MNKGYLLGGVYYCICWLCIVGLISVIEAWWRSLPLVLGIIPHEPNTAYYITSWISLIGWTPFIFFNGIFLGAGGMYGVWLIYLTVLHMLTLRLIYKSGVKKLFLCSLLLGFVLGAVMFGMSAILPAPVYGAQGSMLIELGDTPPPLEQMVKYGLPAWLATIVCGGIVGWLWQRDLQQPLSDN